MQGTLSWFLLILLSLGTLLGCHADGSDEGVLHDDPHRDPSKCEVCKFLATELKGRLAETGKTNEVLETGYGLDQKKKRKEYKKSELRLIEAVNDPHVCDKILEYNIHAERKGSLRFAKGRSQTMETLHNLVAKGVNVVLDQPYEMWDMPSAGVTEMQRQIVEEYEEDLEDWYWNHQDEDLVKFLCDDKVLKSDDKQCLSEEWTGEKKDEKEGKKKKKQDSNSASEEAKEKKKEKKKKKKDAGSDNAQKRSDKEKAQLKGDNGIKGEKEEL